MTTQALILAAGRGSRLGDTSLEMPKPLLQIGPHLLIEHQLSLLAEAGIGPVGMVLGYHADDIREVVGIRAEYILNPKWATTNSLYSFHLAADWITGSVIVLNCDTLFTGEILERLLQAGPDTFAIDSSSGRGREHMGVELSGGVLRAMGKDLPHERTHGENVGILYLGADTAKALLSKAGDLLAAGKNKAWLGEAVDGIARERDLRAVDVADLPWVEIDFAYDLARARKEVWPRIRSRSRSRRKPLGWIAAALVTTLLMVAALLGTDRGRKLWMPTVVQHDVSEAIPMRVLEGDSEANAWYLLASGSEQEVIVTGPGEFRLVSRSVMPDDVFRQRSRPYLLTIYQDGKVVHWGRHKAEPSLSRRLDGVRVSKSNADVVPLAPGTTVIRFRYESLTGSPGLVRFLVETH